MANHFARWSLTDASVPTHRLPFQTEDHARYLPERRRLRYLASRMLLAELIWSVYGIPQLPALVTSDTGRPHFVDDTLPDFSIAYAGNIVGVLLAEEGGHVGLGMEIARSHNHQTLERYSRGISSGEKTWIRAQADPDEATTQLWTLRQSVLKLTGQTPDSPALQLHPASGRLRSVKFPDIQAISDVEALIIWSCALSTMSEPLYLWEFDGGQSWKQLLNIQTHAHNMGPRSLRLTSLPLEKYCSPLKNG
ncbi:phosphopantetheinyl transferase [Erwinia endophytica]|uniref:4'-phosphopantetheinyl transferase family protein n=1 Tax=Erwinia endophytica TaxID=1563158 RepID=UPI001265D861|nr:phosphopantetheinyl transferase [Erwinia endophytica]KAB8312780.1 phosphopantetheinyl transferase [Erwinia endophytica]